MSGVAKDENPSNNSATETASAVQDAAASTAADLEAAHQRDAQAREAEAKPAAEKIEKLRKAHLRVVADNDAAVAAAAASAAPEAPAQRMGVVLRQQREALGYDLEQVSKETRITVSHLRAIEDMTPNLIGEPVYVKGHVRTYARHLRLDADMVLERYLKECALLSDPRKVDIAPPAVGRRMPVAVPVLGILILVLVVAGGAFVVFGNSGSSTQAAAPAPAGPQAVTPGLTAPVTAQASDTAQAAVQPLRIRALRRERMKISGASGDTYRDRYFSPGETYAPRVGAGWTVTTPDGSAFEYLLGDVSLGTLTPSGPVYAQSVDLALARAPVAGDAPDPASPLPSAAPSLDANGSVIAPPASPRAPASGAVSPRPGAGTASASPSNRPARPRPSASAPAQASAPPASPSSPAARTVDPADAAYPDN
jgi:hypothetical protein